MEYLTIRNYLECPFSPSGWSRVQGLVKCNLKTIGAEEDEDSDCNMWHSIFVVYVFLKFSFYFGIVLISNI